MVRTCCDDYTGRDKAQHHTNNASVEVVAGIASYKTHRFSVSDHAPSSSRPISPSLIIPAAAAPWNQLR